MRVVGWQWYTGAKRRQTKGTGVSYVKGDPRLSCHPIFGTNMSTHLMTVALVGRDFYKQLTKE